VLEYVVIGLMAVALAWEKYQSWKIISRVIPKHQKPKEEEKEIDDERRKLEAEYESFSDRESLTDVEVRRLDYIMKKLGETGDLNV